VGRIEAVREALEQLAESCDHLPWVVLDGCCQCGIIRHALNDDLAPLLSSSPAAGGSEELLVDLSAIRTQLMRLGMSVHESLPLAGIGVPHDHAEYVEGCFRCDLNRDEASGDTNETEDAPQACEVAAGGDSGAGVDRTTPVSFPGAQNEDSGEA
jgi:hypothetical protein